MRARWPVLAGLLIVGAGYLGYPYVTLYRLHAAMNTSDAATLRTLVDWGSVREGLKEDICDMVLDEPANAPPSKDLAPFGSGFVHGMTGNALDRTVTPETLVSVVPGSADRAAKSARVEWAFFDGPAEFSVDLRAAGSAEPIRVMMRLHHMRWRVTRVWLPNELLAQAGSGT